MRIIFMGTPDFAVASLDKIYHSHHQVVAVVTAPDKPAGRGQKVSESAVKKYAVSHEIPVLQPEKLRDPQFITQLKSFQADIQVVVAFRMLPEVVWSMPPKGTINLHASLLPQYRGAAPINHAVINGESFSGVTTFLLQHEIDTGNVLLSEKVMIEEQDNAGNLHDKLMLTGADLLLSTLDGLEKDQLVPKEQHQMSNEKPLQHAPKIFKEDCLIDWTKDTTSIYNMIRGLSPYPTAYTTFQGKGLKIFETSKEFTKPNVAAGEFLTDGKTFLKFATADGFLHILNLQLEGKRRMDIAEFLRGIRVH